MTVGAAVRVAGIEVHHAEIQVHAIGTADRRRIAEPETADVAQPAIGSLAVARGGLTGRLTGSLYSNFKFRAARSGGWAKGPARRPGGSMNRKSSAQPATQSSPRSLPSLRKYNCLSGLKPAGPTATSVAGLRGRRLRPARPYGSQEQRTFFQVRPRRAPHAPLMRRSRRGRRFLAESHYLLSPQIPAQSSPQFSAPCQPHCGSAFAPPRFTVARWDFISILLMQNERNPSLRGRATEFS